ncbi:hypothetical protein O4H52_20460 [Sphingomonadaceae bacterium G21617-S1]|jgi:hypothetical protein|uniref:hypothetical protein n=2 Tax=Bacteria TaxID=2 RepID=UPI00162A2EE5|nr:hypothetical protein [Sphingomonas sp. NBWT7]MCZ4343987.1 hypothetical protein [Sphingomonadaceae bacterium G21617-S1]MDO9487900.1 hypothetical protein [Sphingomonadaceae bacterium]QNE33605.1 hypothetical protein F1C10_15940 [Sphingomonas sp. NBWT7]
MLDTTTYLLTQQNAAGPMLRQEEPPLIDLTDSDAGGVNPSLGATIGGVISLGLIVAAGTYLALAI